MADVAAGVRRVRGLGGRLGSLVRAAGAVRLGVLAVVAAGLVLLLLALLYGTAWRGAAVTTVTVSGQSGAPVVDTTADALALDGPSVQVEVRGADPARPVFAGVGREGDVAAYLGTAARTEVTGVDGGTAVTSRTGTDTALPEPAGVDIWAVSASGPGRATLTWPQTPGRWRLVAAADGVTPPSQVVLTWQRNRGSSPVPVLLAVGVLLLVLGLVGLRVTRRPAGRRPAVDRGPVPRVPVAARLGLRDDAPAAGAGARGRAADDADGRGDEPDDMPDDVPDDEPDEPDEPEQAPAPFRAQRPGDGGRPS